MIDISFLFSFINIFRYVDSDICKIMKELTSGKNNSC